MIDVEMKPLQELEQLVAKSEGEFISTIRAPRSSLVRAPHVQIGSKDCPPITNFAYSSIMVANFRDAIVTQTGAVIVHEKYVVEETVEGSLESNGFMKTDQGYQFDNEDLEVLEQDIITFSKFGIFNYSIFLAEIMPVAHLLSLTQGFSSRDYLIHFPSFMSEDAITLRWTALGSSGFSPERAVKTIKAGVRAPNVGLGKANDRYKNHRSSELSLSVSSTLKANLSSPLDSPIRRVYIHRDGNTARRIANFDEIIPVLEKHNITAICLDKMSLAEQVELFSKLDLVIAEHGAGLVNTMFMRPGSVVIEMFPEPLVGRWAFRMIAHTFKLFYCFSTFTVPVGWQWDKDPIHLKKETVENLLKLFSQNKHAHG